MRSLSIGIAILAILCLCSSVTADELTKAEKAARDYSYKKLTFGTTLKEFKRRFPAALLRETDESSGTLMYMIMETKSKAVSVEFFRGEIHKLMLVFLPDALSKIGGRSVFEKKVLDTFGVPDTSKGDAHRWDFPNAQRAVIFTLNDGNAGFTVLDTNKEVEIRAVKASNLDLGF